MDERKRVDREEWAKRVERWRDSGLTTEEFAAELGINPKTLTYWAWTLKREASGKKRVWPAKKRNRCTAPTLADVARKAENGACANGTRLSSGSG
jgi:orotate phosphoribosyltransferase-like protein